MKFDRWNHLQCVQKKSEPPPQTYCTDKCKQAPYWTKLSVQSPSSIWAVVAKFHTIPSYHLTDFQFYKLLSQISVTDMTCLLHASRHAWRHFIGKQNVVKRRQSFNQSSLSWKGIWYWNNNDWAEKILSINFKWSDYLNLTAAVLLTGFLAGFIWNLFLTNTKVHCAKT